jgi:hypothetical protein
MTRPPSPSPPNPRRVLAGRRNVLKRKGLTPDGLARLRAAALANRPWKSSTGPRTPEGKAASAQNGRAHQRGPRSVRELRAEMASVHELVVQMQAMRGRLEGR